MIRTAIVQTLALTLAACSTPGSRDRYDRLLTPTANPSEVVATELAFARAAQEDGQWTAFRDYSTGNAVMFVPEPVNAHDWLSKQENPSKSVSWQPHHVWSSCDGSLAVTKGAWQRPDGSVGYFTTVWKRQRNGSYKWVMDQGDVLQEPLAAPAMIGTTVADCEGVVPSDIMSGRDANISTEGHSSDRTLFWHVTVRPDRSRNLIVSIWRGGQRETILREAVAAGG